MSDLPPITRPNGKIYRPRRIVAKFYDDGYSAHGVLVLGTHDEHLAHPYAVEEARYRLSTDSFAAANCGWWKDTIRDGERTWVYDDVDGRPGVDFRINEDER